MSILIADIGGTNARFALAHADKENGENGARGSFSAPLTLSCADYSSTDKAVSTYLDTVGVDQPQAICFAAAGPVINQCVRFINNDWQINMPELGEMFGARATHLLNDFEAISYSLPILDATQVMSLGHSAPLPGQLPSLPPTSGTHRQTLAVLGPGTGLGVGGYRRQGDQTFPLTSEGGHVGFAPADDEQTELLKHLRQRFERVSNERLLSGPGIVNIYQALCAIEGQQPEPLTAAQIGQLATARENLLCQRTLAIFFEVLGQVAGDLCLTLDAFDGLFIGGGIAQRYPSLLANSGFRAGFENKGRYRSLLQGTPTWLITEKNPGLMGASCFARTFLL